MSFRDWFINLLLGVRAPEWHAASKPLPEQFDDANAIATALRARRDSETG